jgi:hypothetical protein
MINSKTSDSPPCYKVHSDYFGELCVPEDELIPAMQGSPFYRCFVASTLFNDHSSPPSSHDYDSDFSFDSIARYNIDNMMEA